MLAKGTRLGSYEILSSLGGRRERFSLVLLPDGRGTGGLPKFKALLAKYEIKR